MLANGRCWEWVLFEGELFALMMDPCSDGVGVATMKLRWILRMDGQLVQSCGATIDIQIHTGIRDGLGVGWGSEVDVDDGSNGIWAQP